MKVYRTMFQPTQTSMTWRITTQSGTELTRHVFIAFQSSERDSNQVMNNKIFDNANLRRLAVGLTACNILNENLNVIFPKKTKIIQDHT